MGQVIEMTEWNEQRLEELIRRMRRRQASSQPFLTQIMRLDAKKWQALGYDETDRVSVTRYLGSLGCRTDEALATACHHQHPLTLDLAQALIVKFVVAKHHQPTR